VCKGNPILEGKYAHSKIEKIEGNSYDVELVFLEGWSLSLELRRNLK
jgi:hypothetical protein